MPIVVAVFGTNMTRPSGKSTPPQYFSVALPPPATAAENTFVEGSNIPIFDALSVTNSTRPSGNNKPPRYFSVPVNPVVGIDENVFEDGLNIPMFLEVLAVYGTKTTRPSGNKIPPLYPVKPPVETVLNIGLSALLHQFAAASLETA